MVGASNGGSLFETVNTENCTSSLKNTDKDLKRIGIQKYRSNYVNNESMARLVWNSISHRMPEKMLMVRTRVAPLRTAPISHFKLRGAVLEYGVWTDSALC